MKEEISVSDLSAQKENSENFPHRPMFTTFAPPADKS